MQLARWCRVETKIKVILEAATTIPILDKAYPDIFPSITFHLYGENGALFGGGSATEETVSSQVDIWYKAKNDFIKEEIKKIKQALNNQKYITYPQKGYMYETNNKIHHTYFTFECLETEE
jgi:hypothetical protein